MKLKCIVCKEQDRMEKRRFCKKCYLERKRERYKITGRYTYNNICKACKKEFKAFVKNQILCSDCRKESFKYKMKANDYVYMWDGSNKIWEHQQIIKKHLKRNLDKKEVIHHVDENPKNNSIDNLIILNNGNHAKLHIFLRIKRIILEKNNSKLIWRNIIVKLTMWWLNKNNIQYWQNR